MKHINLTRTIPAALLVELPIVFVVVNLEREHVISAPLGTAAAGIVTFVVVFWLSIQVRLGRFPWFAKEGGPDRLILWLEEKCPILQGPRRTRRKP